MTSRGGRGINQSLFPNQKGLGSVSSCILSTQDCGPYQTWLPCVTRLCWRKAAALKVKGVNTSRHSIEHDIHT